MGLLPPDSNMKHGFDMTSYLQDDARLRLQQFAANAASSGYLNSIQQNGRSAYKQPFTIENIIATDHKSSSTNTSIPAASLPGFASQFGQAPNIPSNFMLPYHGIRPSESDLISSLACTYGQINGRMSAIEYYNSLKCSLQHTPTGLPLPVKPTALSVLSNRHETFDNTIPKPVLIHSVDSLLKSSKDEHSPPGGRSELSISQETTGQKINDGTGIYRLNAR